MTEVIHFKKERTQIGTSCRYDWPKRMTFRYSTVKTQVTCTRCLNKIKWIESLPKLQDPPGPTKDKNGTR